MLTGSQICGLLQAVEKYGLKNVVATIRRHAVNGNITPEQASNSLAELTATFGELPV